MRKTPRARRSPDWVDPIPRNVRDAATRGPADERRDARIHEVRHVLPSASDLLKRGYVQQFEQNIRQSGALAKAMPTRGVAMARLTTGDTSSPGLTLQRPVGLTFEQLREVRARDITIDLIIARRVRQVQRFMQPSADDWRPGFRLRFEDQRRNVQDADQERFRILTRAMLNCGMEFRPSARRALKRDKLKDYTAKVIGDSLTLDAGPTELVRTLGGRLHGWSAADGGLVYLTDPDTGLDMGWAGSAPALNAAARVDYGDPSDVFAVYAKDGSPTAFYTHETLLYPIRNVTSDERWLGYGQPEIEVLLGTVTAFLNAMTLNTRSISDNSIPPGLLMMWGDFEEEDIDALKEDWKRDVSGPNNRFRLPLMVGEKGEAGAEFIPTGTPVNELMYARWITLNIALKCARFGMDPVEIGFESFSSAGKSSMSGDDTEERLTAGNDSGLYPLVDWHFDNLNELLQEMDDEVVIEPTGLDVSREQSLERQKMLLTYAELRQRAGESTDKIPDELLNAPYDPGLQAVYLQTLQRQQGADGQAPGAPTGDQQDVDGDGVSERGMDQDGDGEPDAWQDVGPQGQTRMLDHEGNLQQVEAPTPPGRPEPAPAGDPQAEPEPEPDPSAPPRLAKAQPARLDLWWPRGDDDAGPE